MEMVDPYIGLESLQECIDQGILLLNRDFQRGKIHDDIYTHFDQPNGSPPRATTVLMDNNKIISYCVFVAEKPINGFPKHSVGYATTLEYRNQGYAYKVVQKALDELVFGLKAHKELHFITIVEINNIASQKIAEQLLCDTKDEITEAISSKKAYRYTKIIKK